MHPPQIGWQWRIDPPPLVDPADAGVGLVDHAAAGAGAGAGARRVAASVLADGGQRLQEEYREAMGRHFSFVPDRTVAVMTLERLARSVAVPVLRFAAEHGTSPHAALTDIGFEVVDGWVNAAGLERQVSTDLLSDLPAAMWRLHQELLVQFVPVVPMTPERRWLVISEGAETAVQQLGLATDARWWAQWWQPLMDRGQYVPAVGDRVVHPRPVRRVCCFGHALRPRPEPAWCDSCPALYGRAGALVQR